MNTIKPKLIAETLQFTHYETPTSTDRVTVGTDDAITR